MALLRALAFTLLGLSAISQAIQTEKRQALPQVITQCSKPNQVALTFDDGPWIYNANISQTLKNAGAVGTFFVNGNNWGCIYDANLAQSLKNAYDMGHQIASHTWHHSNLTTLTRDQIHDEMWQVEQALWWIIGAYPAMMRPPYGSYDDDVREVSAVRGQAVVLWDFDSGDSSGFTAAQSEAAYDQLIAQKPSNILTLNHEVHEPTAHEVLPYAIRKLKEAGYELVSVAECTGLPAYQKVGPASARNASWHC